MGWHALTAIELIAPRKVLLFKPYLTAVDLSEEKIAYSRARVGRRVRNHLRDVSTRNVFSFRPEHQWLPNGELVRRVHDDHVTENDRAFSADAERQFIILRLEYRG